MKRTILIAFVLASATVAQVVEDRKYRTGAAAALFKRQLSCPAGEGFCTGGFCCPAGDDCCSGLGCVAPGDECCSDGTSCRAGTSCVIYQGQPKCCVFGDCGADDSGSSGDLTTLPGVTNTQTFTIPGGEGTSTRTYSYTSSYTTTSSYTQTYTQATSSATIQPAPAPAPQPTIATGEAARSWRSGVAVAGGILGLVVGLF